MCLEGLASGGGIARLDGADDGVVLFQRILGAAERRQRGGGHQRHGPVHEVQLLHEEAVVRGQMDLLVKAPVGAGHGLRIIEQGAVVLDHVAQHAHLFVGGVAGGKVGGKPLQFGAHHV